MISLDHLIKQGMDFGVHCSTGAEFHTLVNHINANYPLKRNERIDKLRAWSDFGSSIVVYPNFHNCNKMSYGRLGGQASHKRRIYEFFELQPIEDLPIEQSDMDISLLFSEVMPC